MPSLAKLIPSAGSGSSGGTSSAGRVTSQVSFGCPYRHKFSFSKQGEGRRYEDKKPEEGKRNETLKLFTYCRFSLRRTKKKPTHYDYDNETLQRYIFLSL